LTLIPYFLNGCKTIPFGAAHTDIARLCSQVERQKKAMNSTWHIYLLAGSCRLGTISKYQFRIQKVDRKAVNIGEVWNPVCCHGNKNVRLILRSSSWIVLPRVRHFWFKLGKIVCWPSYLIKIQLSLWCHLPILKTWSYSRT